MWPGGIGWGSRYDVHDRGRFTAGLPYHQPCYHRDRGAAAWVTGQDSEGSDLEHERDAFEQLAEKALNKTESPVEHIRSVLAAAKRLHDDPIILMATKRLEAKP
jgi:hypothetical protein